MKNAASIVPTALLALLLPSAALASDHEEISQLRQQLQVLSERLAALESKQAEVAVAPAPEKKASRPDKVRISGDLRYRHEGIDEETRDERTRHRIRARVGLSAQVNDSTEIGVRLASGSGDPVSTNQSFDGGSSSKSVVLDRAYIRLSPTENTTVTGGKMGNPFYLPGKSSLMWDGDLSPEGLAFNAGSNGWFGSAAAFLFEERSSSSDSLMFGGQVGHKTELASGASVAFGLGYYDYSATMGRNPFFDGEGRGNTLDADGDYAFDYNLTELFAEFKTKVDTMPLSVYANWVKNSEATSDDQGYALGARAGKASAPGTWEFGYTFKDLEADAVIATFTDSDIGGGGTGIRGHVFDVSYGVTKKSKLKVTYFLSENGLETSSPTDYNRLQADFSVKY